MLTFAVRAPPLGLLLVLPVLNSEKLVLEQHASLLLTFAVRAPPGAAVCAAGDEFREASFGATLFHFYSLLLSAPPLGLLPVLPVLNSEKLVLEQHSFTFADFCCPRPPLGRSRCLS